MAEVHAVLDTEVLLIDVQYGETVKMFLERVSAGTGRSRSLLSAVHEGVTLSNGDVMSSLGIAGGDEVHVICDEKKFSLNQWGMSATAWWVAETLSGPRQFRLQKLYYLLIADMTLIASEREEDGASLLHVAVEKDLMEEVVLLLYMGADVTATNDEGETALHVAAKRNLTDILRTLLPSVTEAGLIDEVDAERRTALYHAARNGNDEPCKILKCNGADVHCADYNAWSPCAAAEYYGYGDTADLIAGATIECQDTYKLEYCVRLVESTWEVIKEKCQKGGSEDISAEQRCNSREEKCRTTMPQEYHAICA